MWVIVSLLIQVGHVRRFVATGDIKSQLSNLFQLFSLSIYYLPVLTIEEVSSARILTSRAVTSFVLFAGHGYPTG